MGEVGVKDKSADKVGAGVEEQKGTAAAEKYTRETAEAKARSDVDSYVLRFAYNVLNPAGESVKGSFAKLERTFEVWKRAYESDPKNVFRRGKEVSDSLNAFRKKAISEVIRLSLEAPVNEIVSERMKAAIAWAGEEVTAKDALDDLLVQLLSYRYVPEKVQNYIKDRISNYAYKEQFDFWGGGYAPSKEI